MAQRHPISWRGRHCGRGWRGRVWFALRDQSGATTLEWALLLAAFALPCYFIFKMALATLIEYYRMMTTLNALPYP